LNLSLPLKIKNHPNTNLNSKKPLKNLNLITAQWTYDDPRWDSEIPNWWDEDNFVPPEGPAQERSKTFWHKKAQNLLHQKLSQKLNTNRAKNLILMVGDGMGLPSQMAARSYLGDVSKALSFEKFPFSGLAKVYCVNYQVPDSASTATALLTGVKNNFMVLGLTADVNLRNCSASLNESHRLDSIMRFAQKAGKSTGIVTNTRLTHATPAASYAISASRQWEGPENTPSGCPDIADQLINGGVGRNFDVMMGGGGRYFLPTHEGGRRNDNRNLLNEFVVNNRREGKIVKIPRNRTELNEINVRMTDKILGIFAESHLDYKLRADDEVQPTLTEMTAKALEVLKKNRDGFVLMVEGGRIDTSHHENRAQMALAEVVEFHKTVEFLRENTGEEDTLIVVTADHSHPFSIGGYLVRNFEVEE
jgi:alkaline phosphatase